MRWAAWRRATSKPHGSPARTASPCCAAPGPDQLIGRAAAGQLVLGDVVVLHHRDAVALRCPRTEIHGLAMLGAERPPRIVGGPQGGRAAARAIDLTLCHVRGI